MASGDFHGQLQVFGVEGAQFRIGGLGGRVLDGSGWVWGWLGAGGFVSDGAVSKRGSGTVLKPSLFDSWKGLQPSLGSFE
jgi:hypothetical protein